MLLGMLIFRVPVLLEPVQVIPAGGATQSKLTTPVKPLTGVTVTVLWARVLPTVSDALSGLAPMVKLAAPPTIYGVVW